MIKKIVIASDSFKGSLTSKEVASAAAHGIRAYIQKQCNGNSLTRHNKENETEIIGIGIADGGEGTTDALATSLHARMTTAQVHDPLGRPITARYAMTDRTAIIEMSAASGLTLLSPDERNPLLTSTYGTGELILDAYSKGCRKFMIGIGGSATNDGGTGMLEALGFRFIGKDGKEITRICGGKLSEITAIDSSGMIPGIQESEFIVACDVDTPFCGPEGAAAVFGPQKGATPEIVAELEDGMQNLNRIIAETTGIELYPVLKNMEGGQWDKEEKCLPVAGAGAAGGLGGALHTFMGAELRSGIDMVLDTVGFDESIKGADMIITGEGKIDSQTGKGKAAAGVLSRAQKFGIPVIAIAGIVDMTPEETAASGFAAVLATGPRPENESDLRHAMQPEVASKNISDTVAKALESLSPSLFRENL